MRQPIFTLSSFAVAALIGTVASIDTSQAQKSTAAPSPSGYHLLKRIEVGGEGGWDYLTVDSAARRLYVSRSTRVMVFDLDTMTSVGEISDTPGVHGVAIADDVGRGFTSNGRDESVTMFDLNGKGMVFVNLDDKSEIVALDSRKLVAKAHWPIAPGEDPSGMAIDRKHMRLFSVCGNKKMTVIDASSGKVIADLPIGGGTDAAGFDPETDLAFSSNGEGTLTVVHQDSADKYSVVENVTTQRGARTMALDPKTHKVYLATAQFGPPPAATPERPSPRPAIVPGTFVILVFGR
jgi:DNA-binding beta-propeller fold protein YncE